MVTMGGGEEGLNNLKMEVYRHLCTIAHIPEAELKQINFINFRRHFLSLHRRIPQKSLCSVLNNKRNL